jgi:cold-inducible RNA-binding protein
MMAQQQPQQQQMNQQPQQDPHRSVYVGNIAWRTTEQEIGDTFANFGYVTSVKIITDKETGRSKGFGFVEFQDPSLLQTVIGQMNGYNLNGRQLRVNAANGGQGRQQMGQQGGNFNNMQQGMNNNMGGMQQMNQMPQQMNQPMGQAPMQQPGMQFANMGGGF